MTEPPVIVAGWRQVRAELEAARRQGRAAFLCSPEGAGATLGAGFWAALQHRARQEFPDVEFVLALDCADAPGHVLAALRAGVATVIFRGPPDAAEKLRDIAGRSGAKVLAARSSGPTSQ